jgi:hypothetical protein
MGLRESAQVQKVQPVLQVAVLVVDVGGSIF